MTEERLEDRWLPNLEVSDRIGSKRIGEPRQLLEVLDQLSDASGLVAGHGPGDHACERPPFKQPTNGDSLCRAVVRDEDPSFRCCPREEHLVLCRLRIEIDGPHYVPAAILQASNQVIVDAGIRKKGEAAGHYLRDRRPR